MRAVNLVPKDARRARGSAGGGASQFNFESVGPAHFVIAACLVVALLMFLKVNAGNGVKDKQATLAALQGQVATEQARAAQYSTYISFVQAAQQREQQVREIAQQRFPWERTLNQISELMPASTSLSSLNATTSGSTSSAATTAPASSGPSFTLTGCADTPNQNGVATLLRRLGHLSGVSNVGFQSSTRATTCGNQFTLGLSFGGAASASSTATAATSSGVATTSTTAAPTVTSTATPTTTSTGAAG